MPAKFLSLNNTSGHRTLHTLGCGVLCSIFLLSAIHTGTAGLLAYEGFNYTANSDLSGASGGNDFGFGTNIWATATGDSTVSGSLTYTDSLGNSLSNSGNHVLLTGSGGSSSPARVFDFARGTDGTTTWISFVGFRRGADTIRVANLQFRTNTSERIAFGKATTNVATVTWSVYHSGAGGNSLFSTNALDVSSFVLVRIDHLAGNDNAYMWINPLLNAEPSLASASVTYTNYADYGFNGLRGFAGNAGSGGAFCEFEMDEIRVGESFTDVTPHTPAGGGGGGGPRFTAIQTSGNDLLLSLTGAVSTAYTVFGATNLTQTPWDTLGIITTSGAGAGTFTDTNALVNQLQRFYRAQ